MNSLCRIRTVKGCFRFMRPYSSEKPSPWLHDNMPGPYPKTEEERAAAAKKYELLREEYQPYPDDGWGYGDYPNRKEESLDVRNPYYPWTDDYYRRLHGEPFHPFVFLYTYEKFSTARQRYSMLHHFGVFVIFCGIFALPFFALGDILHAPKLLIKQYPEPGVIHYTFELTDEEMLQEDGENGDLMKSQCR